MPRLHLPLLLLLPVTLTMLFLLIPSSPPPPQPTPHSPIPLLRRRPLRRYRRPLGPHPVPATAAPLYPVLPLPPQRLELPPQRPSSHRRALLAPSRCSGVIPRVDPAAARGRRIRLVGDSLLENLVGALLYALRASDASARKWKRDGAWRGGYFPQEDVVAYQRAVLLAKYTLAVLLGGQLNGCQ